MFSEEEEYILSKVKEGLSLLSYNLSPEEDIILTSSVFDLDNLPDSYRQLANPLKARCIAALSSSYSQLTQGKNPKAAIHWRDTYERLYKSSDKVIRVILIEWYIEVGRAQEKQALGCLPTILSSVLLILFIIIGIHL
ncbi:MAG: hypothetical protein JXB10_01395 [Pirellulales bacterium]|nr:hypothetical protein [Pirellulales bacterium]